MSELDGISVVLPSLDPDEKLLTVIDGLLEYGFSDIILVNDGSKAENLHYFEIAAQNPHVQLLHHNVNRGKGAALKTAFDWFLHNRPSGVGVITVDGDNQHHPADTSACAKEMLRSGELVLGVRNFSLPQVPFRSRAGNRITSFIFKIFVGMKISDTQTGLRAIPKDILPVLCSVSGDRFEYETNMLLAMKEQSIPFREVKIRTVYIEENKSSHFRAVRDSWRIYKLILAHFFRYTASSLISAVVDEGLYIMLTALLHSSLYGMTLTAVATFGSRAVSSLINFILNKNVVFHAVGSTGKAMLRYYTVAVPTALLQMLLTHGINTILQIDESWIVLRAAIYAFVMIGLYFATFLAQKHWVFAKERQKTKL